MKSKIFKISIIAIIVILITTFIFIGKTNSSKNLSKNFTSNTESKEKVKQKDIQEKTENVLASGTGIMVNPCNYGCFLVICS